METLQTLAPIRRISVSTFNNRIDSIAHYDTADFGLDMDQPYQRGHVWGLTRRRNLIRSFLLGVPIPSLIINNRWEAKFSHPGWDEKRCNSHAVIDGKQRCTTILMFMRGELAVPASWWTTEQFDMPATIETDDGLYVDWNGLTRQGQFRFRDRTIGVAEGQFSTLAEEQAVFDLVNFGGVAQGETDNV
ncbi:hypothetical protein Kisp02_54160 [Kineosporia sp. NBRC 101731]|nr:hypothetical protein Kisp02_54160 [Kineosporia sp. NBRC 101731]